MADLPQLTFATAATFESWLQEHYAQPEGIWLKFAKKASGIPSVTYQEALEIALCYGWIDGQLKGLDDTYYLQRFTPRRPKSLWSKRNIVLVGQLTAAGRMQPAGQIRVDAAKADGRWAAAYDKPSDMQMPQDFLDAVQANPAASVAYAALNQANRYAIAWRLQTAKLPATRERRLNQLLALLERGEKLY